MKKEEMYKELVRYGSIMRDNKTEDENGFHRVLVFSYQGMEYTVELSNGIVLSAINTTIF